MKRLLRGGVWPAGWALAPLALGALLWPATVAYAQGVTSSSITGIVKDAQGLAVPGASVVAVHEPSGTTYETVAREDGRFSIQGMRVGGPYTVTATLSGFQPQSVKDVTLSLGVASDLTLTLGALAGVTEEVTVVGFNDPVFSSERTGSSTSVGQDALLTMPNVTNRLDNFVRLTPESGGRLQFAGQDNRLNNITVDGSYFNNSFGLAGAPGDRTGVAPISIDAIEQIQVNIAPFDVRQGNFVGAGVNTVTKSGTNSFAGATYYQWRNDGLVGTKAGANTYDPGTFEYHNFGVSTGGPIRKNKLFFFFNFEDEATAAPGTTFTANPGGAAVGGNMTRVLASDLDALSAYLASNFNYETGPYQGYNHATPARRYLTKVDYNVNPRNKLIFRYNQLDSSTDVLVSTSSSLGWGGRRSNTTGLNFQNSNYQILENIRSFIGEWNSTFGTNKANTLIAGYTYQDESRGYMGTFFPMVDILEGSSVYTTFGFEPFTPNNELRYKTFQVQDNFLWYRNKHSLTIGGSLERYESENVFFPGSQSVYVYNSLADFYLDANDYLANRNRTTSPVTLRRFQVRWMNIPGLEKPIQPLEVWYGGVYAQDQWQVRDNLKLTYGLRLDVPMFGETGFQNAAADALTFRDETGAGVQYQTAKLPDANILWSPRVGFNWDVKGDRSTQVRGGSGIFTGRPAYVWISNQIGNTGVLTGFERLDNTRLRPWNPDPNAYKPTNVTGEPASSYELALTDPGFKFPQVWRNNIAVDQKLPWGWTGTVEFLYNRDVNGIYYINANLPAASTAFTGADSRPRWAAGNRIHANVANAIVMKNQNVGRSWNISGSVERAFKSGFWAKAGYRYGESKNTIDPGSIAFGSWNNNPHAGDPNNPGVAFSNQSPGHRFFLTASYGFEYFSFGRTTVSMFWDRYTGGSGSYAFSGDLNGDGGSSNDLIYIPRDQSEMNFQTYTTGGRTFTAAEQAAAWDAYINQDSYLSENRGKYAERGAVFMPMVNYVDVSVAQDIFKDLGGRRHSFQFRVDMLNFLNLINSDWGVGQRFVNTQPLLTAGVDAQGRALYRLRVVNNELMSKTFEPTAGLGDVYKIQFSVRYTFK
ncbi:MAG: carboxypeptidase regulatory-like domain-containing protein [Acidobacteriota bacterium]